MTTQPRDLTEQNRPLVRFHEMLHMPLVDRFSVSYAEIVDLQLAALRDRFDGLVSRIPMLSRLAEGQSVSRIASLEDAASLLFRNATYKSYPFSFLDSGQFDRLTRWLDGLTAHDLSSVDATGCKSIDDWIDLISEKTEIRILHSSGTTGKLSFLPRSQSEVRLSVEIFRRYYEGFTGEPGTIPVHGLDRLPIFFPSYRHGAMEGNRLIDGIVRYLRDGEDDQVFTLYPGRMSADALSLGGRLKGAAAKGEAGTARILPHLLARRDAMEKERSEAPLRIRQFFERFVDEFRGRRVLVLSAGWAHLHAMAIEARERGIEGVFAPDSLIVIGGGVKGHVLPEDYRENVKAFLGVQDLRDGYGMSECMIQTRSCMAGKYHIQPWAIPYLIDPDGKQLLRTGTHRGHLGIHDLLAHTYWGGFLTGDEVTLSWGDQEPCACGRIGPYIHKDIRRIGTGEGGDDKITCAGATEAHDRALAYITEVE